MKKVLNLYAGLGGNRKLWENIEVTAIELNSKIADVYKDFFPNDKVIITDAHQYLLDHYDDGWDLIWSSPPCPSHSKIRRVHCLAREELQGNVEPLYPDMKLYEEILLLEGYCKDKWVIENVESWYNPLIEPQRIQRHYFWANFVITSIRLDGDKITGGSGGNIEFWEKRFNFNLDKYTFSSDYPKNKILRNCVHPILGKHIFDCAFKEPILDKWM